MELILKARGLYEERNNIKNGNISSFKDFIKKWKGNTNGHDFFRIIDVYNIQINDDDKSMLDEIKQFTGWAGRYPYPIEESLVEKTEKNGRELGSIGLRYKIWANEFYKRQVSLMVD